MEYTHKVICTSKKGATVIIRAMSAIEAENIAANSRQLEINGKRAYVSVEIFPIY